MTVVEAAWPGVRVSQWCGVLYPGREEGRPTCVRHTFLVLLFFMTDLLKNKVKLLCELSVLVVFHNDCNNILKLV